MCNGEPVRQPEKIPAFVPSLFIDISMEGGGKKKGKKKKGGYFEFFEFYFWWDVSFARVACPLGLRSDRLLLIDLVELYSPTARITPTL